MRFSAIAASVSLAVLSTAQSLDGLPDCAKECLVDAVEKSTSCTPTDLACVCKNFEAIQGAGAGCVLSACGTDVALNEVLPATQELCKDVDTSSVTGGSTKPPSSPTATVVPPPPADTTNPDRPPVVTGGAMGTAAVNGLAMLAAAAFAL